MADIATLGIAIDTSGLERGQRALQGVGDEARKVEGVAASMATKLAALGAALASAFSLRKVIEVGAQFQALETSLKTVTGSAQKAQVALAWITDFAARTPFDLQQVTQAFIKLKSLGLDPSQAALTSYGNTASAMGKSLNQMIEAVADAATLQFERLKEFGIRANQEGAKVKFTFQGVTTTVGKSAEEITAYLKKIGDVNFAGAMDEQSKTLGGALSNLSDSFNKFLNSIAKGGFGNAIADITRGLSAVLDQAAPFGEKFGAALAEALNHWKAFVTAVGVVGAAALGKALNTAMTSAAATAAATMLQKAEIITGAALASGSPAALGLAEANLARVVNTLERAASPTGVFARFQLASATAGVAFQRFLALLVSPAAGVLAIAGIVAIVSETLGKIRDLREAVGEVTGTPDSETPLMNFFQSLADFLDKVLEKLGKLRVQLGLLGAVVGGAAGMMFGGPIAAVGGALAGGVVGSEYGRELGNKLAKLEMAKTTKDVADQQSRLNDLLARGSAILSGNTQATEEERKSIAKYLEAELESLDAIGKRLALTRELTAENRKALEAAPERIPVLAGHVKMGLMITPEFGPGLRADPIIAEIKQIFESPIRLAGLAIGATLGAAMLVGLAGSLGNASLIGRVVAGAAIVIANAFGVSRLFDVMFNAEDGKRQAAAAGASLGGVLVGGMIGAVTGGLRGGVFGAAIGAIAGTILESISNSVAANGPVQQGFAKLGALGSEAFSWIARDADEANKNVAALGAAAAGVAGMFAAVYLRNPFLAWTVPLLGLLNMAMAFRKEISGLFDHMGGGSQKVRINIDGSEIKEAHQSMSMLAADTAGFGEKLGKLLPMLTSMAGIVVGMALRNPFIIWTSSIVTLVQILWSMRGALGEIAKTDALQKIGIAVAAGVGAFMALAVAVKTVTGAMKALNIAAGMNPVVLLITAIVAGFAAAGVAIWLFWDDIKDVGQRIRSWAIDVRAYFIELRSAIQGAMGFDTTEIDRKAEELHLKAEKMRADLDKPKLGADGQPVQEEDKLARLREAASKMGVEGREMIARLTGGGDSKAPPGMDDESIKKIEAFTKALAERNDAIKVGAELLAAQQAMLARGAGDNDQQNEELALMSVRLKAVAEARQKLTLENGKSAAIDQKKINQYADQAVALEKQRIEGEKFQRSIETRNSVNKQILDNQQLSAALAISQERYEIEQKIQEIRENAPKLAEDEVRALAEAAHASDKALKDHEQQVQEMQRMWEHVSDNIHDTLSDSFKGVFKEGFDGFKDFGQKIIDIFKDVAAEIVANFTQRAFINPILNSFGIGGGNLPVSGFGGFFGGGGADLGALAARYPGADASLLSAIASLPSGSATGGGGGILGLLNNISSGYSAFTGGLSSGVSGTLGKLGVGPGTAGFIGNAAGGVVGGYTGYSLAKLIHEPRRGPGDEIGATIGGLAATTIATTVGGMALGAALGSVVPVIGTLIGALIGGLFGPHPSTQYTGAFFDPNTGRVMSTGADSQATQEGKQQRDDMVAAVTEGIKAIISITGGTVQGAAIVGVETGGASAQVGGVNSPLFQNAGQAVDWALKELIKTLDGAKEPFGSVAKAMAAANVPTQQIADTLDSLNSVLADTEDKVSEWVTAQKKINDVFYPLIAQLRALGNEALDVEAALRKANEALRVKFMEGIQDAIDQIEAPLAKQFKDLLKTQADRLADTAALTTTPSDLAKVMHLNTLEVQQFLEQAKQTPGAIGDITEQFNALVKAAQNAGRDTAPVISAFREALAGVVSTFDQGIADQLLQIASPTATSLKALLTAQNVRLEQAQAIGANIVAVERLNAAETASFFKNLTDQQRLELGDYLGMIQDFSGRIAVVGQQLADAFTTNIDKLTETTQAVKAQADSWASFRDTIGQARQGIVDQYGFTSPLASLEDQRRRLRTLASDALAGNTSAQSALPQVANSIIQASRGLYGGAAGFQRDVDLVTRTLQEVEDGANTQAQAAADQATMLQAQVDLLTQIRDVLQKPDANLEWLRQQAERLAGPNANVGTLLLELVGLQQQQIATNLGLVSGLASEPNLGALLQHALPVTITPIPSQLTGLQTPTPSTTGAGQTTNVFVDQAPTINAIHGGSDNIVGALATLGGKLDKIEERLANIETDERRMRILTEEAA